MRTATVTRVPTGKGVGTWGKVYATRSPRRRASGGIFLPEISTVTKYPAMGWIELALAAAVLYFTRRAKTKTVKYIGYAGAGLLAVRGAYAVSQGTTAARQSRWQDVVAEIEEGPLPGEEPEAYATPD